MKRFWNWVHPRAEAEGQPAPPRRLYINGTLAESSWFDDDVTPAIFQEELESETGPIEVWINSPGGDCVAAARIYNMLVDYKSKGSVTIFVDGIAASAASVVAMAGSRVKISKLGMLMIHNPMTIAMGNTDDMQHAIDQLNAVKESIMNAYQAKTGLTRAKISHLMDDETWMDANKALELGFADEIVEPDGAMGTPNVETYSETALTNCIKEKLVKMCQIPAQKPEPTGRKVADLKAELAKHTN